MSKTSILIWCISTYAKSNKPVKNVDQLVVEVATESWKKTQLIYVLWEINFLSQKLCCFSGSRRELLYFSGVVFIAFNGHGKAVGVDLCIHCRSMIPACVRIDGLPRYSSKQDCGFLQQPNGTSKFTFTVYGML